MLFKIQDENIKIACGHIGRFPGRGHGNMLQYSFLENPMDRGAWQATVNGVAELDMTEHRAEIEHSDQCEVIHCSFDLHLSSKKQC